MVVYKIIVYLTNILDFVIQDFVNQYIWFFEALTTNVTHSMDTTIIGGLFKMQIPEPRIPRRIKTPACLMSSPGGSHSHSDLRTSDLQYSNPNTQRSLEMGGAGAVRQIKAKKAQR